MGKTPFFSSVEIPIFGIAEQRSVQKSKVHAKKNEALARGKS